MLKNLALLYEQDFDQETNTFKLISLKGVFLSRLVNKKASRLSRTGIFKK